MTLYGEQTGGRAGAAAGPRGLVVLGATGSIGDTTFGVLEGLGDGFRVVGLSGHRRLDKLIDLARRWRPDIVAVAGEEAAAQARASLPDTEVVTGAPGLVRLATCEAADTVVNGLVGAVGLEPTVAAVEAGKTVAMANKEPLVMAGGLILDRARACGARILPLDSEPNALWQCLRGESPESVKRLVLTASGGAFRGWPPDRMAAVKAEQALQHPTWKMGAKITIDCATLMNKGFEVIEAAWLFGLPVDRVDVVVHRESVIHSMVEFVDGSYLAHLGRTHMHLPIQYALTQPGRRAAALEPLDLVQLGALHFEAPDEDGFPCLPLCYEAGRAGGLVPTVLNAANEVAVEAFLAGHIGFLDIYEVNRRTTDEVAADEAVARGEPHSVAAVLVADRAARQAAARLVREAGRA